MKAAMKAIKAHQNGKNITSIDVRNAYNSVPHDVLMKELGRRGLNQKSLEYIQQFLKARNTIGMDKIDTGVP